MIRLARAVAVAALAAGVGLLTVAPASAAPTHVVRAAHRVAPAPTVIDVSCIPPSTDVLQFNPPLTLVLTPTTITKTTRYSPCTAPLLPNLTSGSLSTTSFLNDACPMVLNPGTVVQTITWNNGMTSTLTLSRTAAISGTTLTVSFVGTVTGGLFLGSNVKQTYTASAVALINCLNGSGVLKDIVSRVNLTIYH